jgi:aspartate aminotransferase
MQELEGRSDVVGLHKGEPAGNAPLHVVEAAHRQAVEGARYGPGGGLPQLRGAIAAKLGTVNGIADVTSASVVVTHGAVQGCAAVFDALLEAGDEVLVPDAGWPNYRVLAHLRGARVKSYRLVPAEGFAPDLDHLVAQLTPSTRIMVVNSPSNPTGWVGSDGMMSELVDLVRRHGCLLVADEAYDQLVFDGGVASSAAFDPDHVISLFSFSKTYSMTGWRVGYLHAPQWLVDAVIRIEEGTLGGVSVVTQAGALAALEGPQDVVDERLITYRRRRDLVAARLAAAGLELVAPAGGLFAFLPTGGTPSDEAAARLIELGVAMVPGTVFGAGGEGFLRASLGADDPELDKGIGLYVRWRLQGSDDGE